MSGKTTKLGELALGYAAAGVASTGMLLLGILGNFGVYTGAVEAMKQWHLLFSLSVSGIVGGMVEAAILSFLGGYAFAWIYNKTI